MCRGARADHGIARLADRPSGFRELEAEIDDLLREKEEVEKWATAESA
jgi:hypothetical protein